MSIAFRLLLISIAIIPIVAFSDGLIAQSLFATLTAAGLAAVAISARAADVSFVARATRYLKFAAALPAIWMIVQVLPTPFSSMSHSIWVNAREALNQQLWGHISVDVGATVEALAFYLANISLILAGIFVAKDRRWAELLLLALTADTLLTIIALLVAKSGLIASLVPIETDQALSGLSAIGAILSLTAAVHTVERYQSSRTGTSLPKTVLALCGGGLLICIAGLAATASLNVGLTVVFGAITFGSIQAIRRVGLAGWVSGIFISAMITAAAMIVLWRYDFVGGLSPLLQFATSSSPDAVSVARRILSDTGWMGIGTGAYTLLLPVYEELGSSVTRAPSTAAAFAIELGWPMALFAIVATIGLIVIFFRGALIRGRDSFYPAAAAACSVIVLGQAFCDISLLHSCVAIAVDLVVALGLAQSRSQEAGP